MIRHKLGGLVESLAGLSLDFIDDPGLIRDINIPDHIRKVASSTKVITSRDFSTMSESDFGVVFLTKHGHHIPKYPIHDKFHTWAATVAFDKTAMKLPPAARSIAATFIKRACELYNVEYPEYMDKIASSDAWNNVYDMGDPPELDDMYQDDDDMDDMSGVILENLTPAQRVAFRDRQDLSGDASGVVNPEALMAALSVHGGPRGVANQDQLTTIHDTNMNPHARLDAEQQFLVAMEGTKNASEEYDYGKELGREGIQPQRLANPSRTFSAGALGTVAGAAAGLGLGYMASKNPESFRSAAEHASQLAMDARKWDQKFVHFGGAAARRVKEPMKGVSQYISEMQSAARDTGAMVGSAVGGIGSMAVSEYNANKEHVRGHREGLRERSAKTASIVLSENPEELIKQAMIDKHAHQFAVSEFALVGEGVRRYPLYTPELVKKASVFFEENQELMAPAHRWQFANKLSAKLASQGPPPRPPQEGTYARQQWEEKQKRKKSFFPGIENLSGSKLAAKLAVAFPEGMTPEQRDAVDDDDGEYYSPEETAALLESFEETPEEEYSRMRNRARWGGSLLGGAMPYIGGISGYQAGDAIADSLYSKYGGVNYGNQLESQLHMRKQCLQDKVAHVVLDVLYEKRASMSPDAFAANLEQFDIEHGLNDQWDKLIYDPYASTFGEKRAALDYFYEDGSQSVTGEDLRKLAEDSTPLRGLFDNEIVDEFENDPVAIFSSMPVPQKTIMMKAARSGVDKSASVKKKVAKHAASKSTGMFTPNAGNPSASEEDDEPQEEPSWLQSHHDKTRRALVDHHYKQIGPDPKRLKGSGATPEETKQKLEIFEQHRNIALEEAERLADSQTEKRVMRGLTRKSAADFTQPSIDTSGGREPIFGGKNTAIKPVIPMPPSVSGVKIPGPRVSDSSGKMASVLNRILRANRND